MRTCIICGEGKPLDQFHKAGKGYRTDCKPCRRAESLRYRAANSEWISARKRDEYQQNKDRYLARAKKRASLKAVEISEYHRQWRSANAEWKIAYDKSYRRQNAGRMAWHSGNRKKAEKRAAPEWLTEGHWNQIQAFYDKAIALTAQTGVQYHVDHIEPIQGKNSCGLHVPWNLQVITASANRAKGNRLKAA